MDFRFLKRRKLSALIVGLLLSGVGIGLLLSLLADVHNAYRLQVPSATKVTKGQIVKLGESHGRGGPSYCVSYTYQVGQMEFSVWATETSRENLQILRHSDSNLLIRYLAADPSISEPELPEQFSFRVNNDSYMAFWMALVVPIGYWGALYGKQGQKKKKKVTRKKRAVGTG